MSGTINDRSIEKEIEGNEVNSINASNLRNMIKSPDLVLDFVEFTPQKSEAVKLSELTSEASDSAWAWVSLQRATFRGLKEDIEKVAGILVSNHEIRKINDLVYDLNVEVRFDDQIRNRILYAIEAVPGCKVALYSCGRWEEYTFGSRTGYPYITHASSASYHDKVDETAYYKEICFSYADAEWDKIDFVIDRGNRKERMFMHLNNEQAHYIIPVDLCKDLETADIISNLKKGDHLSIDYKKGKCQPYGVAVQAQDDITLGYLKNDFDYPTLALATKAKKFKATVETIDIKNGKLEVKVEPKTLKERVVEEITPELSFDLFRKKSRKSDISSLKSRIRKKQGDPSTQSKRGKSVEDLELELQEVKDALASVEQEIIYYSDILDKIEKDDFDNQAVREYVNQWKRTKDIYSEYDEDGGSYVVGSEANIRVILQWEKHAYDNELYDKGVGRLAFSVGGVKYELFSVWYDDGILDRHNFEPYEGLDSKDGISTSVDHEHERTTVTYTLACYGKKRVFCECNTELRYSVKEVLEMHKGQKGEIISYAWFGEQEEDQEPRGVDGYEDTEPISVKLIMEYEGQTMEIEGTLHEAKE